jgi:predicted nucleic acid-binding protein
MRALYVDTGVWLALLDAADPLHARARAIIDAHKSYPFLSSDAVLSETVTLLRRELGPGPAAGFGRDFLEGKVGRLLPVEKGDWLEGLNIIERYQDQRVSAADASSMAIVRRLDIEKTASFDKHFKIILTEREVLGQS